MTEIDEHPSDSVSTVGEEPASAPDFIDDNGVDGEDDLEWARRLV